MFFIFPTLVGLFRVLLVLRLLLIRGTGKNVEEQLDAAYKK
jgi:hypothetical protein